MVLRAAADSSASAMLLSGPLVNVSASAIRLASTVKLPLVQVSNANKNDLIDHVTHVALAHRSYFSECVFKLIQDLENVAHEGIDAVLAAASKRLNAEVALTTIDGSIVAGSVVAEEDLSPPAVATTVMADLGTATMIYVPIAGRVGRETMFWLAARLSDPSQLWGSLSPLALQIAAWTLACVLATQRLESETDARRKSNLLDLILSVGGDVSRHLLHQVSVQGWRLDGWCTAIYIRTNEELSHHVSDILASELRLSLAEVSRE